MTLTLNTLITVLYQIILESFMAKSVFGVLTIVRTIICHWYLDGYHWCHWLTKNSQNNLRQPMAEDSSWVWSCYWSCLNEFDEVIFSFSDLKSINNDLLPIQIKVWYLYFLDLVCFPVKDKEIYGWNQNLWYIKSKWINKRSLQLYRKISPNRHLRHSLTTERW